MGHTWRIGFCAPVFYRCAFARHRHANVGPRPTKHCVARALVWPRCPHRPALSIVFAASRLAKPCRPFAIEQRQHLAAPPPHQTLWQCELAQPTQQRRLVAAQLEAGGRLCGRTPARRAHLARLGKHCLPKPLPFCPHVQTVHRLVAAPIRVKTALGAGAHADFAQPPLPATDCTAMRL